MQIYQKIIRNIAIFIALLLVVFIIAFTVNIVSYFFIENDTYGELQTITENEVFNNIDIEINASYLEIINNDNYKVETNNEKIKIEVVDNKLTIKDTSKINMFNKTTDSKLIIYLPEKELENVRIKTGAGALSINNIITNSLDLELGAGVVTIDKLIVNKNASINGGTGEIKIKSGTINNLDLELGVGETTINSDLIGTTNLDTGIGELNINLEKDLDKYTIKVSKGIGDITLDNKKVDNGKYYEGENTININGGIGSITIKKD